MIAHGGEIETGFPLRILELGRFATSASDCTVEIFTAVPSNRFDITFDSRDVWSAFMRAVGYEPEVAIR